LNVTNIYDVALASLAYYRKVITSSFFRLIISVIKTRS